jgi:hypothetical protein
MFYRGARLDHDKRFITEVRRAMRLGRGEAGQKVKRIRKPRSRR